MQAEFKVLKRVAASWYMTATMLFVGFSAFPALAQITIPTVPVVNRGNAADSTGYGSVAYTYNIGATEVTNAQYAAFLNAVAASDPFNLYNTNMAGALGGIIRSGGSGTYSYATASGRENNPVNYVSFWSAARFANWLHNDQGSGDTETGAYTLGGVTNPVNTSVTRNAGWQWAVASEDEWYKAAYHQPASQGGDSDDYWLYPTSSNTITTAQANFGNVIGNTTPVGSYAANFYGAFDMGGNVFEWNEAIPVRPDIVGPLRGIRGGSFMGSASLRADVRGDDDPTNEIDIIGFRVTQFVEPPPCAADYNGSGDEGDILDFLDFFDDFGQCDQLPSPCGSLGNPDLNGDTIIDILDFLDFLDAFGQGC